MARAVRKLKAVERQAKVPTVVPPLPDDPEIAKALEAEAAAEAKRKAKTETDAEKIARLEKRNAELEQFVANIVPRIQKGGAIMRRVLGEYDAAIGL